MLNKFQTVISTSAFALALVACGGGGGSTGSTTPPTSVVPPTPNAAPAASITVTNMSPNEGLTSTLDASSSSDSDGDALTYSWTQLSGPNLKFTASNSITTDVSVPNLTEDATARIQLQVSDGTDTATEEVALTLTNVDLQPIYSQDDIQFSIETIGEYSYKGMIAKFAMTIREYFFTGGGKYPEMLIAIFDDGRTEDIDFDTSSNSITSNSYLGGLTIRDTDNVSISKKHFDTTVPARDAITEFDSNTVYFTNTDATLPSNLQSVEVQANQPCIATGFSNWLMIGQRDNGIKIFYNSGRYNEPPAYTFQESIETDATICAIIPIRNGFIGYNDKTGELLRFRYVAESGQFVDIVKYPTDPIVSVGVSERILPNLNLPNGVTAEFVKAIPFKSTIGSTGGLALLYSSGDVDGEHRIVIAEILADENGVRKLDYKVFEWAYGIPEDAIDVHRDRIFTRDGDISEFNEIVITTKNSPFAVIFSQDHTIYETFLDFGKENQWTGPHYLELGLGATDISTYDRTPNDHDDDPTGMALWVNYANENKIKLFDITAR